MPSELLKASVKKTSGYEFDRKAPRMVCIQMLDAIVVHDGKNVYNWCDLHPGMFEHNSLVESLAHDPFYKDAAVPRKVAVTDNGAHGMIYKLWKHRGYLGCM